MNLSQRAVPIQIQKIRLSPYFFRDNPSREALDELKASLSKFGQIHAVSVVPAYDTARDGQDYELINGHRRLLASTELGWEQLTADVWEFVPEELNDPLKREKAIRQFLAAANLQEPLTPLERAEQYQRLMDSMGMDTKDLAVLFDQSETDVLADLKYIFIDPEVRQELHDPEVASRLGRAHLDTLADFAAPTKKGWRLEAEEQKRALKWLLDQEDKRAIDDPALFEKEIKAIKLQTREKKTRENADKKISQVYGPDQWVRDIFRAIDVLEKAALKLHEIKPASSFKMEYVDQQAMITRLTGVARGLVGYAQGVPTVGEPVEALSNGGARTTA